MIRILLFLTDCNLILILISIFSFQSIIPVIFSTYASSKLAIYANLIDTCIVRCLYMNLIILVLCSACDLILIPFVLPLLAHCYYHAYFNKKSLGFRSFFYAAPHVWNHLPNNICTALTYMSFKKRSENLSFYQSFPT